MDLKEGKYTVERFAEENNLSKQSALNKLSKLKKLGLAEVSGGGKQKRIYAVSKLPRKRTNGFYDIVNRYSPEKLQPKFEHYVNGRYSVERAIIEGIRIGDARTLEATAYLVRHISNWKQLFDLAKKDKLQKQVIALYQKARKVTKTRRMPQRYIQ
jgi:hypothetical protein